jgi:hypothetical protein
MGVTKYLIKLDDSPEDWHLAPIRGGTQVHKFFPFYPADLATLENTWNINNIPNLLNALKQRN